MQKTLHIALCDTNFADRKQMERLLTRESDKRLNSCVFYMDTYGSKDSLLETPRVYDAYFLDIPDNVYSAYDLAKDIQAKGILSPIIFCNSTMNYRECGELLPNSVFINKPIVVSELSLILDEILIQKQEHYIPTIEIRNAKEVFYLKEKEIIFCEERPKERKIHIHLQDGSIKEAEAVLENFYTELMSFDTFFMANKSIIANARYVKKVSYFSVTLENDLNFRLTYTNKKDVLSRMERINQVT